MRSLFFAAALLVAHEVLDRSPTVRAEIFAIAHEQSRLLDDEDKAVVQRRHGKWHYHILGHARIARRNDLIRPRRRRDHQDRHGRIWAVRVGADHAGQVEAVQW